MKNRKKIIIVAHCLLTKGFSGQYREDMNEILKALLDSETGVIQMPCPNLILLPTKRQNSCHSSNYNHIFSSSSQSDLIRLYSDFLSPFIMQIEAYQKQNFEIIGLVGIKDSPKCEVESINNITSINHGIFMKILRQELKKRAIHTNIVNIDISPTMKE